MQLTTLIALFYGIAAFAKAKVVINADGLVKSNPQLRENLSYAVVETARLVGLRNRRQPFQLPDAFYTQTLFLFVEWLPICWNNHSDRLVSDEDVVNWYGVATRLRSAMRGSESPNLVFYARSSDFIETQLRNYARVLLGLDTSELAMELAQALANVDKPTHAIAFSATDEDSQFRRFKGDKRQLLQSAYSQLQGGPFKSNPHNNGPIDFGPCLHMIGNENWFHPLLASVNAIFNAKISSVPAPLKESITPLVSAYLSGVVLAANQIVEGKGTKDHWDFIRVFLESILQYLRLSEEDARNRAKHTNQDYAVDEHTLRPSAFKDLKNIQATGFAARLTDIIKSRQGGDALALKKILGIKGTLLLCQILQKITEYHYARITEEEMKTLIFLINRYIPAFWKDVERTGGRATMAILLKTNTNPMPTENILREVGGLLGESETI